MLWYKAWLETRWRFLIGLVLLVCSAAFIVLAYTRVMRAAAARAERGRRQRNRAGRSERRRS